MRSRPGDGLAAVDEHHRVPAAVAADLHLEPARKRVHDRDADAVQAARDLVALAAELAAGVEHREHDLGRGLVGIFGVRIDRNAAAVVDDTTAAVGQQRDVDAGRVTRERLVDGVVDDLVHEVVQTRGTGRTDVHTGAFAHRLKTLENRDVLGAVRHAKVPSSKPVVGVPKTPRPGTQKPWSQGVFYVDSVYQKTTVHRFFAGPETTTRIDVTEPSPQ